MPGFYKIYMNGVKFKLYTGNSDKNFNVFSHDEEEQDVLTYTYDENTSAYNIQLVNPSERTKRYVSTNRAYIFFSVESPTVPRGRMMSNTCKFNHPNKSIKCGFKIDDNYTATMRVQNWETLYDRKLETIILGWANNYHNPFRLTGIIKYSFCLGYYTPLNGYAPDEVYGVDGPYRVYKSYRKTDGNHELVYYNN